MKMFIMYLGDRMKQNNKINNSEMEMGNLVKIILIILVVFGIFYVITYYMQKNKKAEINNTNNNTVTIIQYDEILIGDMLRKNEESYYVLIVNKEDYNERYKEYLSKYTNNNKFYYALSDNGLNKNYVSDISNLNVSDMKDFKVKDTALLKINSGKIVESYDGNSEVMKAIIELNR